MKVLVDMVAAETWVMKEAPAIEGHTGSELDGWVCLKEILVG